LIYENKQTFPDLLKEISENNRVELCILCLYVLLSNWSFVWLSCGLISPLSRFDFVDISLHSVSSVAQVSIDISGEIDVISITSSLSDSGVSMIRHLARGLMHSKWSCPLTLGTCRSETKSNLRKGDIKPHDSHKKDQLLSFLLLNERRKRIHKLQTDIKHIHQQLVNLEELEYVVSKYNLT
jgi:hypothetical protein